MLRRPASSKDVTLSYRHILDVLFNELKVNLGATPLTIVYFNSSLNYIGFAYEHACRVLGNLVYNGEKKPENARVVMYHASVEYGSEKVRIANNTRITRNPYFKQFHIKNYVKLSTVHV